MACRDRVHKRKWLNYLRTLLARLIAYLDTGPVSLRRRAWLWLASATDDLEEKKHHLAKVLSVDTEDWR